MTVFSEVDVIIGKFSENLRKIVGKRRQGKEEKKEGGVGGGWQEKRGRGG